MDQEILESFRQKLERDREETRKSLARVQAEGRGLGEDCPTDSGEVSVMTFSREFLFQQSTLRRQLLSRIDAALERIRTRTFGECAECGEEIDVKRLQAMPFTAYCRECQENLERQSLGERKGA